MNPYYPPIQCNHCDESFFDRDECEKHTKQIHKKVPLYVCMRCNERVTGTDNFDKHLEFVHGTKSWQLNLGIKEMKRMFKRYFEL